jgi:hypothetical protein
MAKVADPEIQSYIDKGVEYVKRHAQVYEYFSAEEVCDSYKMAGLPVPPDKGWRDRWGTVMSTAARKGYIKKAGKVVPKSGATHMTSTALWLSNLYKGERTLVMADVDFLKQLKAQWMTREITDIAKLIEKAYDFGFDQGVKAKG